MKNTILGAIVGDIIGSVYEWNNYRGKDFELFDKNCKFTDDSVMTIAVADALMNSKDMAKTLKEYGRKYPNRGYGGMFYRWLDSKTLEPYNSFGNGSAMRASAAGFMTNTLEEARFLAKKSAEVTHNHPEGIKGAEATAAAIYFARNVADKQLIRELISTIFGYHLNFTCDEIRATYQFNETCQETVPQSIVAFLDSENFEDAIRNAISIGGDSDTVACICGGIAAAFYKEIPEEIRSFCLNKLDEDLRNTVLEFEEKF